jgi:hypothetical protein
LVQFVLTLIGVLILIGGAAWALRAFMVGRLRLTGGRTARLGIIEAIPVDQRRRLVLVRRDQFEHLLLIGGPTDVVVEPTIFRGVPLSARMRPEPGKSVQAPAIVGPPVRAAAPPVEIDRERRAPAERPEAPVVHRVPPTPAAVFAPPGVPERKAEREPVEVAPLPPEAPAPLAQPPRNPPPVMQETGARTERMERQSLGLRAAVAGEEMQERRQPMRVVPEPVQRLDVEASVRTAAAVRQLAAEDSGERVGLWQARNGPRYEFFGPPRGPAEASPGSEADLDRWSEDRDSTPDRTPNGHTNGIHGPTPEQISSLEQEMARLLGEIAGKRTS